MGGGGVAIGMLDVEMRRLVEAQRLGYVATVDADGTPNLSPKGTVAVWDEEHLVFADIRSPRTVANLRRSPAVEINVVDPLSRRGFRFKGTARVIDGGAGAEFDAIVAFYRRRGVTNPIRAGVLVRVERALAVTSPAYDTGATEAELRTRWARFYGRQEG